MGSHFINAYCSFAFFGLRSANFPLKQMDKKIKKKTDGYISCHSDEVVKAINSLLANLACLILSSRDKR